MKNIADKIQKFVNDSVVLKSIRNGVMAIVPLIIIGSLSMIIASLPSLLKFIPAYSDEVKNILMFPYTFLNGILSIAAVAGISFYHAKAKKVNQLFGVIIAIVSFLLATNSLTTGAVIETTNLGASGLFTGIIFALLSVEILAFFNKIGFKIKLPDTVPPAVSLPFEHMISGGSVIVITYVLVLLCTKFAGCGIPDLVTKIISPLFKASSSFGFYAAVLVFVSFMWFFGIHGYNCVSGILLPLMIATYAENAKLVAAGQAPTNIYTLSSYLMAGNVYWFIPLMFILICKSAQLKAVGKVAIVPAIFNISEPITFGAPLVGNVTLLIPNILYQIWLLACIALSTKWGLLTPTFAYPGTIMPHPLFGYIATQDWRVFVVFAIGLVGSVLIWLPFLKKYDAQLVAEEAQRANEKVEAK